MIPQNGLLSELSWNIRAVIFSKSKFLVSTPVSDTRYKYPRSQKYNPFYPFNNQFDCILINYFAESKTTKRYIDKFLSHLLMKPIIKNLSYYNANKWIVKLFAIS